MESQRNLNIVHNENIRNHQIGGETDGMKKEIAKDIGFGDPSEETTARIKSILGSKALDQSTAVNTVGKRDPQLEAYYDHLNAHLNRTNKQVIDPNYFK
jgi:hypothetical protein